MSEWKECRLGDLCTKIGSGATPSGGKEAYKGGDFALIRSQNVLDFEFSHNGLAYINDLQAHKLDGVAVATDDVLLNITGDSVARTCIVDSSILPARVNQHVAIIRVNPNMANSRFIHAWLIYKKPELLSLASFGATRNAITKRMIEDLSISLPPLSEQKKIAAVLSALDEKIETNRKINARLEELAQAIFKSWFIDFEPFGGKMPNDWKEVSLNSMVESIVGGDWGKEEEINTYTAKVLCVRGADLNNIKCGSTDKAPTRYILNKNFKQKALSDHNIVVEISGGSPTQSTGRIAMISSILLKENDSAIICTNFCKALKIKEPYCHFFYYLWNYLYNNRVMFIYENGSNGLKNLNLTNLIERELCNIPTERVALDFYNIIEPIFSKIQKMGIESARLAELRDTLLPKLMSGELKPEECHE